MFFYGAGRGITNVFLLYCVIPACDMKASRAVNIICNVYSVLVCYPYLGCDIWESINNCTHWKEQGTMNFCSFSPPFSSSNLLRQHLRILNFLLLLRKHVVNMSSLLGLKGFLSVVHTHVYVNKRLTKEIFRRTFQTSVLKEGMSAMKGGRKWASF